MCDIIEPLSERNNRSVRRVTMGVLHVCPTLTTLSPVSLVLTLGSRLPTVGAYPSQ